MAWPPTNQNPCGALLCLLLYIGNSIILLYTPFDLNTGNSDKECNHRLRNLANPPYFYLALNKVGST
jgi:hypothetical protein